jgi:hypothetical protein
MTENETKEAHSETQTPEESKQSKQSEPEQEQDIPLPEPSLTALISGLATQTMISLGVFPNPINGSTNMLLNQGKHLIETIALIDEKTKGNQTPEESKTISHVLHELRMIYVAAQNEKQKQKQNGGEV